MLKKESRPFRFEAMWLQHVAGLFFLSSLPSLQNYKLGIERFLDAIQKEKNYSCYTWRYSKVPYSNISVLFKLISTMNVIRGGVQVTEI